MADQPEAVPTPTVCAIHVRKSDQWTRLNETHPCGNPPAPICAEHLAERERFALDRAITAELEANSLREALWELSGAHAAHEKTRVRLETALAVAHREGAAPKHEVTAEMRFSRG